VSLYTAELTGRNQVEVQSEVPDRGHAVTPGTPQPRPTILIVDDERAVLESLSELLRRECRVLVTTDPDEAVNLVVSEDVALVLSDQRMPRQTGVELLARVAAVSPQTVRVLFTGYADIDAVIQGVNDGHIYRYLTKPWEPEDMLGLVRESTRDYSLASENSRLSAELAALSAERAALATDLERTAYTIDGLAERNEQLRAALADLRDSHWHLRRLRELLPMCASCHKVRTGDEYWQNVQQYLLENADFLTHGLCPQCLAVYEAGLDAES
jgi:response regulator RpfG family c-di-GMP phosphodiesterase